MLAHRVPSLPGKRVSPAFSRFPALCLSAVPEERTLAAVREFVGRECVK